MLFLRPCSLCSAVFPSLLMSHPFIKYAANSTSVARDSGPYAVLQHSLQCSSLTSHESHSTFDDPRWTPTGGLSGKVWLPSWRACAISLANASIASSLSHLRVTLLCPKLHSRCFPQRSSNCGLTVSVRLDLSSTLTPPTVKKLGCCSRT